MQSLFIFIFGFFQRWFQYFGLYSRIYVYFFSVAQQPESGLGRLIVKVSRSHTHRHTHPVGLLWTSDKLVAETATFTTHNKHKRRIFMPSAWFEPAIPAIERLQTYALDRTATGIGLECVWGEVRPIPCHEGTERIFSFFILGVTGQRHAPAALPPGERLGFHGTGGWVGTTASVILYF